MSERATLSPARLREIEVLRELALAMFHGCRHEDGRFLCFRCAAHAHDKLNDLALFTDALAAAPAAGEGTDDE